MNKLLSANFRRMKRDVDLWIVSAAVFVICALEAIDAARQNEMLESAVAKETLNGILFEFIPFLSVVLAIFITLFIGKEYGFGTIRNKLSVGHTRINIYFSNFISALAGSLIIYLLMLGGVLATGIPILGGWQGDAKKLLFSVLIGAFSVMAMVAVFTMFSMLSSNRAVTAVSAMVFGLALVIFASTIYNGLAAPEMASNMELTAAGVVQAAEPQPNPFYIGGVQRKVYEFLLQFLPTGQGILLANEEITHPVLNLIYSAVLTVTINICGIFAFKKKEIK